MLVFSFAREVEFVVSLEEVYDYEDKYETCHDRLQWTAAK